MIPFRQMDQGAVATLYRSAGEAPLTLRALQNVEAVEVSIGGGLPEIRSGALRKAAQAYGARGGLAYRGWEINERLRERDANLSKVFNFEVLTIPTIGGSFILPPVITQADDAISVSDDGTAASASKKVYHIVKPAKISLRAPNWRTYLVRTWRRRNRRCRS